MPKVVLGYVRGKTGEQGQGLSPQGTYDESVTYHNRDLVTYNGSSFIALKTTTGNPPSELDTENWQLSANGVTGTADGTTYDNTTSGLDSLNLQEAIDKVVEKIDEETSKIPTKVLVAPESLQDSNSNHMIDADRLGGELPEYYATKESVMNVENQIGTLEELSTTDKATLVEAINELFTELSEIDANGLETSITAINDVIKNAGLNSPELIHTKWENIEKVSSLKTTFFTNWNNHSDLPINFGSGVIIPALDPSVKFIFYIVTESSKVRNTWIGVMKFSDETTYTIAWRKLISDEELPELISNENFFINPDFQICQRGLESYTTSKSDTGKYYPDRWFCHRDYSDHGLTFKRENDGLHMTFTSPSGSYGILKYTMPVEDVKKLSGKTITISCNVTLNGGYIRHITVHHGSTEVKRYNGNTKDGLHYLTITMPNITNDVTIRFHFSQGTAGNKVIVHWCKMELGSVPTQFTPPNLANELEKCRYYYQEFAGTYLFNSGGKTSGKYVSHMLYCNKMRILLTVSYKGTLNNTASIYVADTLGGNKIREIQTLELKASQFGNQYRIGAIVTPTDTSTLAAYGSSSNEQIVFTGSARVVLDAEIY